jgi:MinD superfamily P-loop ATPase
MPKPVEITVISGKGGTGKTVITSCLAALMDDKVVADCDVDAPDLHLLLKPTVKRQEVFLGSQQAEIDGESCAGCGRCLDACRFGAIKRVGGNGNGSYTIDKLACEGCGVCAWVCPAGAIRLVDRPGGNWFASETRFGPMIHACLGAAQENSGQLVSIVRKEARRAAIESGHRYVLIDGPPGIGCPVIASVTGANLVIVVTEPTLSGVHDLERVLGLTGHFGIPTGVIINKHDLNGEVCLQIMEFLDEREIPLLGRIHFDPDVNRAIAALEPVVEFSDGKVAREIRLAVDEVIQLLKSESDKAV